MTNLLCVLSLLVVSLAASPQTEQPTPSPSKPAASGRLRYDEKSRERVKGVGEVVSYAIWAEGLPTEKKYSVTVQWMNGETREVQKSLGLEPSGYAMEAKLASSFPGERFVLSLVSEDGGAKASVEITPAPIHAQGSGDCRLLVRPMSLRGEMFQIAGIGFAPGHDLRVMSVSSGEHAEQTVKGNADGTFKMVVLPGVVGKTGGDAAMTVSDSSCSVTVAYKWGDQLRNALFPAIPEAAHPVTTKPPSTPLPEKP